MNTDHTTPAAESIDTSGQSAGSGRSTGGAAAELLIPPAMLVVAIAIGLACHLHFGFPPEIAAALGLAVFCIMLLCHVLLRSAEQADQATDEPPADVSSPLPKEPRPLRRPKRAPEAASATKARTPRIQPPTVAAAPRPADAPRPAAAQEPVASTPRETPPQATPPEVDTLSATAVPPEVPAPQQWTYRPLDLQLPDRLDNDASPTSAEDALGSMRPTIVDEPPSDAPSGTPTFGSPMLSEQERIEQILKRLAAQIRSGASDQPAPSPADAPATPAALAASISPGSSEPAPVAEEAPSDSALESAVNTLRSTVEAMRTGSPPFNANPLTSRSRASQPPLTQASARPATAAEVRLAAVAEALAAERANVFLQPILALKDDTARHFEVSVRLRTRDGQTLERQQVAHQIRGAGLLPLLDAIGVRHSAGFALKLERRGREGAVFSQVAGESLERAEFVNDIAGRQAQGIADRLVLSFDQEEIRGLGVAQLAALAALNDLGFRFAIKGVSHLDMDFEALAATGFAFVKLEAEVFATGLALGGTVVPASDLANFFREHDLAVIVGRIQDEAVRNQMLQYGVTFGQGALFGEPRPVPIGTLDAHDGVAA